MIIICEVHVLTNIKHMYLIMILTCNVLFDISFNVNTF